MSIQADGEETELWIGRAPKIQNGKWWENKAQGLGLSPRRPGEDHRDCGESRATEKLVDGIQRICLVIRKD